MRGRWILVASLLVVPSRARGEDRILDWVKVTDRAGWQPRDSGGEVVYNDRLWVLGGWFDSFSPRHATSGARPTGRPGTS